jgi:hypothetical protein
MLSMKRHCIAYMTGKSFFTLNTGTRRKNAS